MTTRKELIDSKLSFTEIRDARRVVCLSCEHNNGNGLLDRCMKCGCFIKAKTMLPFAHCPEQKWML